MSDLDALELVMGSRCAATQFQLSISFAYAIVP